jgi:hypothetical protein
MRQRSLHGVNKCTKLQLLVWWTWVVTTFSCLGSSLVLHPPLSCRRIFLWHVHQCLRRHIFVTEAMFTVEHVNMLILHKIVVDSIEDHLAVNDNAHPSSRLTPYTEDITGDHHCGFQCNRSTTDHIFYIHQILKKKSGNTMKQCSICL